MAARIFGLGVVAIGAVYLALALQLPVHTLNGPGAGFFPLVIAAGLLVTGVATALLPGANLTIEPAFPERALKVAAAFISLMVFCLLLPRLGYIISGVAVMIAMLKLFGASWRLAVPLAIGSAIVTYYLFIALLGLPLPRGSWLP
ncbi:hypothetical protein GCM10007276_05540 [Agaricicola taiwanensis]|uniref:DUF1468 domain-containing protein n=1 Tax=Agaricicola taiwanensis TaxID=591372 RepID=A0A8J2VMR2_9RHOB|nr:tripartite tricarboxylate transporter TctB family protein [Agaricicola taiwanensis]GGE31250.1 hypothetical protein GCM10007276_05540 [Agaricicola taiwanensis]